MLSVELYLYKSWSYTNTMKRFAGVVFLILFAVLAIGAQAPTGELTQAEVEQLLAILDMDTSLADIVRDAGNPVALARLSQRVVLIDGTVASTVVIEEDPESFYAEVELISGAWQGLSEVRVDRAYVVLLGSAFADRIPTRPTRVGNPAHILRNNRVLVLGRVIDLTPDDFGQMVPLLVAYQVRRLN